MHEIVGWIRHPSPKDLKIGSGWFADIDRVYRRFDGQVVCMMRDIDTKWGEVTHLTIKMHYRPGWMEKQQIKNELFGKEAVAIEVFPKESELIDEGDIYHLWILHETEIPFGLSKKK